MIDGAILELYMNVDERESARMEMDRSRRMIVAKIEIMTDRDTHEETRR
jgi:hypothetical protein